MLKNFSDGSQDYDKSQSKLQGRSQNCNDDEIESKNEKKLTCKLNSKFDWNSIESSNCTKGSHADPHHMNMTFYPHIVGIFQKIFILVLHATLTFGYEY